MSRKAISQRTRFAVLRRDNFRCIYCGATADDAKLVIDHIEPYSKGGPDHIGNYATACQPCNAGKSASEVLVDSPAWTPTADRLVQCLYDLQDEVQPLDVAIAVEIATMALDGPGEGIPFEHLIDVMMAPRLREYVYGMGIEDARDAFTYEAFGLSCWLELCAKRQELGMPNWKPAEAVS